MATLKSTGLGALGVLLIALASLVGAPAAFAQASKAPVIIVIDKQRILRESTAVQDLQRQVNERRSTFQSELKQQEQKLRQVDQELVRQRAVLSADAFAKKRKELEEQVNSLQRQAQDRKKSLDQLFGKGMSRFQKSFLDVAIEIAKEHGADLVFSKAAVVLVNPDFDITDEALTRLNKRLPSIDPNAANN